MTGFDARADLLDYLQGARETLLWKLDGLGEYDIRRPLTPTGTNLLGLVKHQAGGELIYFGDVFGRPHGERLPWLEDGAGRNAGMWAAPDETRDFITGLYRRAWKHADATIAELPLDAPATVPWWGGATVTLCHILVHMTAETQRHAWRRRHRPGTDRRIRRPAARQQQHVLGRPRLVARLPGSGGAGCQGGRVNQGWHGHCRARRPVPRTTATGQWQRVTQCWPTEPRSMPANAPWP